MHRVEFGARAVRELRDCTAELRAALLRAVEALALVPRPPGAKKLSGPLAGSYRIRVRNHRVIYDVDDRGRAIIILKIGPRKSIYR